MEILNGIIIYMFEDLEWIDGLSLFFKKNEEDKTYVKDDDYNKDEIYRVIYLNFLIEQQNVDIIIPLPLKN
jgi:hypothetical protein